MKRRRGLIAGLLAAAALGVAAGIWFALHWTSPSVVRRQVLAALRQKFPGAEVQLGSARLRLLGGVSLSDLTLCRHDDPDRVPFLTVPSAVLYHDKELLAEGKFALRKVELHAPRVRLVRDASGRWNTDGLFGPPSSDEPVPTLVVSKGVVRVEDHTSSFPAGEVTDLALTLVNDPADMLCFRGSADAGPFGRLDASGRYRLHDGEVTATVGLPALPVGPALLAEIGRIYPDAATHLRSLSGRARVSARFCVREGALASHDLQIRLDDGRYEHPLLPLPLEGIALRARCDDGQFTLEELTARLGDARVRARLEAPPPTAPADRTGPGKGVPALLAARGRPANPRWSLADWERRIGRFDVDVEGLKVDPEFLRRLPQDLRGAEEWYRPQGPVGVTYRFERRADDDWERTVTLRPAGLAMRYCRFPYPVTDLTGTIVYHGGSAGPESFAVELAGKAGGQPLGIRGDFIGDPWEPTVRLDVTASRLPIDDALIDCLAPRFQGIVRSFRPAGSGDVLAEIRYTAGEPECNNHYVVTIHKGSVAYAGFPYLLEDLSGTLEIRTGREDHWEFRDFQGSHHGGRIVARGRNVPAASGSALEIFLRGESVPLDEDLEQALTRLGLQSTWQSFAPGGRVDFEAEVRHAVRPLPPPGPTQPPPEPDDLDVRVAWNGGSIRPDFLSYELTDLRGRLHYASGRAELTDFAARHGAVRVSLGRCHVVPHAGTGAWADIRDLAVVPLSADPDLLAALPAPMAAGLAAVGLRGPAELRVRQLVVDRKPERPVPALVARGQSPDPPGGPTVYWDGELRLAGASFSTGVDWTNARGRVASRGLFQAGRLERLVGNVLLEQVALADQPLTQVHARFEDDPQAGGALKVFPHAGLYGGTLDGEARVGLSPLTYSLKLTAAEIDLERLARHNRLKEGAQLKGHATAQLFLSGRAEPEAPGKPTLEGGGSIDVPQGQIYNLPLLLDLMKVLNLRAPDRTAFEEAHGRFRIRDRRVYVDRLDLLGNALSLGGQGELNLDGTDAGFELYAVWSRLVQLMPPLVRELPSAVSKGLYKIKLTGSFGEGGRLDIKQEPIPMLVEPLKHFLERVRGEGMNRKG